MIGFPLLISQLSTVSTLFVRPMCGAITPSAASRLGTESSGLQATRGAPATARKVSSTLSGRAFEIPDFAASAPCGARAGSGPLMSRQPAAVSPASAMASAASDWRGANIPCDPGRMTVSPKEAGHQGTESARSRYRGSLCRHVGKRLREPNRREVRLAGGFLGGSRGGTVQGRGREEGRRQYAARARAHSKFGMSDDWTSHRIAAPGQSDSPAVDQTRILSVRTLLSPEMLRSTTWENSCGLGTLTFGRSTTR